MIDPADLERHIGQRQNQRARRDRVGVSHRTPARHRVGQQQREYRRDGIAEQQQVDDDTADVDRPQHRRLQHHQPEHRRQTRKHRQQDRAGIVNDTAGAQPQPLQSDRHCERHADL